MELLDPAVFLVLLELLVNVVRSVLAVRVVLLVLLVNVVPLVDEVFPELTDPQDLKVHTGFSFHFKSRTV